MAAEALAVIASVSAVVQLIDFSVNHLDTLRAKVEADTIRLKDVALQDLCGAVATASSELLEALAKVKIQGSKTKWITLRKAIRSVWSKEEILGLERRLASFRAELNLHVTVTTRQQLESLAGDVEFHFAEFTDGQKSILDAILQNRSVFEIALQDQSALIQTVSDEITGQIVSSHEATRTEIRTIVADAEAVNHDEHDQTRQAVRLEGERAAERNQDSKDATSRRLETLEVEVVHIVHTTSETNQAEHHQTQSQIAELERALRGLSDQMTSRDQELKAVLEAFQKSKSKTTREQLFERSKIITAALLALETMSRSLKSVLLALQDHTRKMLENVQSTEFWSMTQYARRVVSSPSTNTASQHIPRKDLNLEDRVLDLRKSHTGPTWSSHDSYFNYFYNEAFLRSDMVDEHAMNEKWKFRAGYSSASKVHREGFVVDENLCNSKCLWFLASLALALETHLSPEGAAPEVLRYTLDSLAPFRPLEEDLAYWTSFARSRGMDEAMGSQKFCFNALAYVQQTDLHDFLRFLLARTSMKDTEKCMLHARDGPTMPIIQSLCRSGLPFVTWRKDAYNFEVSILPEPSRMTYLTGIITWSNKGISQNHQPVSPKSQTSG